MSGYGAPGDQAQPVYTCGNCGSDTTLKAGEPIACKECGYRILYKKRTKRVVQFEAR
jgi:DNA-directed RNA polymerase I, II, and III subunit RPABC4